MSSFEQLLAFRKDIIIGTKYKIVRKIGNGAFGQVYLGVKIATGTNVAIKVESSKVGSQHLRFEYKVYRKLQGSVGIPRLWWFGCTREHNVLVMDLLGQSLEDLFNFCSRKFSVKTVLMLADQMIERVEFIHSKGIIHRDIKPDNLLMGVGRHCNELYMIDFGLAKEFRIINHQAQIGFGLSKPGMVGNARYASINALRGYEQSWRDDMESLGYVLIYLSRGSLPWQGIKANTKQQKFERIKEKKRSIPIEELCKGYPQELAVYLNYCRDLRFEEAPDYTYLRQLFQTLFRRMGFEYDYAFDFTILRQLKQQSTEDAAQHSQDITQQPPLQPPPNEEPNAGTAHPEIISQVVKGLQCQYTEDENLKPSHDQ